MQLFSPVGEFPRECGTWSGLLSKAESQAWSSRGFQAGGRAGSRVSFWGPPSVLSLAFLHVDKAEQAECPSPAQDSCSITV